MRKCKFTPEQILLALRQAEGRTAVVEHLPEAPGHGEDVLPLEEAVHGARRERVAGVQAAPG